MPIYKFYQDVLCKLGTQTLLSRPKIREDGEIKLPGKEVSCWNIQIPAEYKAFEDKFSLAYNKRRQQGV